MKKLTLTLIILIAVLKINAQSDTVRIYELEQQNTYDSSQILFVDKSTLDSARYIKMGLAAPRIKDLASSTDDLDPDLTYLRILDDGASYTEKKTALRYIKPAIADYTLSTVTNKNTTYFHIDSAGTEKKTTWRIIFPNIADYGQTEDALAAGDKFRFSDNGTEKYCLASDISAYVIGTSGFTSAVETKIVVNVDSSFIANLMYPTEVNNQTLITGGIIYAYLSLRKIGDIVTANFIFKTNTATGHIADYTIPSYMRPSVCGSGESAIEFNFPTYDAASSPYVQIRASDGRIEMYSGGGSLPRALTATWITD